MPASSLKTTYSRCVLKSNACSKNGSYYRNSSESLRVMKDHKGHVQLNNSYHKKIQHSEIIESPGHALEVAKKRLETRFTIPALPENADLLISAYARTHESMRSVLMDLGLIMGFLPFEHETEQVYQA